MTKGSVSALSVDGAERPSAGWCDVVGITWGDGRNLFSPVSTESGPAGSVGISGAGGRRVTDRAGGRAEGEIRQSDRENGQGEVAE
jgi:hypothetical protein